MKARVWCPVSPTEKWGKKRIRELAMYECSRVVPFSTFFHCLFRWHPVTQLFLWLSACLVHVNKCFFKIQYLQVNRHLSFVIKKSNESCEMFVFKFSTQYLALDKSFLLTITPHFSIFSSKTKFIFHKSASPSCSVVKRNRPTLTCPAAPHNRWWGGSNPETI